MKSLCAAAAAILMATAASAATLSPVNLADATQYESSAQLFSVEIKRDQIVKNGGGNGKDAFLRNGTETNTPASENVAWGASGTSYAWSLGYDGNIAKLTFGSASMTRDISPDGVWNALGVSVRAFDPARFSSVTTTLTITKANGTALSTALLRTFTNGDLFGTFALNDLGPITSLEGSLQFSFTAVPNANGSPNSRVGVNLYALQVTPAAVPLPATLTLFAPVLAAFGLLARRRRRMAPLQ